MTNPFVSHFLVTNKKISNLNFNTEEVYTIKPLKMGGVYLASMVTEKTNIFKSCDKIMEIVFSYEL